MSKNEENSTSTPGPELCGHGFKNCNSTECVKPHERDIKIDWEKWERQNWYGPIPLSHPLIVRVREAIAWVVRRLPWK